MFLKGTLKHLYYQTSRNYIYRITVVHCVCDVSLKHNRSFFVVAILVMSQVLVSFPRFTKTCNGTENECTTGQCIISVVVIIQ